MSDGGATKNTAVSVKVSVGKEIDKSVGGVLSALLLPGATQLGNVVGDGIGMLADIVKAKRERNAQLGLERVREKLESADVDLKDVTPPKEEELHLLITGLSLSDDVNVRDLWSGLFAKAIEPSSPITAERAYISVLQSLSPMDAKIIDLISLGLRLEHEITAADRSGALRTKAAKGTKEGLPNPAAVELTQRCQVAIDAVQKAAEQHGLSSLKGQNWASNLMRQGIIERAPIISATALGFQARSLDDLTKKVATLDELARWNAAEPDELLSSYGATPHLFMHRGSITLFSVRFTKFGRQLVEACGLL